MGCKMAKLRNKKHPSTDEPLDLTKQEIEQLSRKELQGYCKKYGIKANGKTAELQEQLIKLSLTYQAGIDENANEIREENATAESSAGTSKKLTEKPPKSKKKGKTKTSRKEKAVKDDTLSKRSSDEQDVLETSKKDKVESHNETKENIERIDSILKEKSVHHDGSEESEKPNVDRIVSDEDLHNYETCTTSVIETNQEHQDEDQAPSSSTEHEDHIKDGDADYVALHNEKYNMSPNNTTNSTANLNNQIDSVACHTTSICQDGNDSIYGELISDETLNATFNLDRTYVKSKKLLTPAARLRNATFVLERQSMDNGDISGCDSTSTTEEKTNQSSQKATTSSSRWCVVEGVEKSDRDASWKLIKLRGGRPVVPNTFGKYIQFVLEPSQRDVPEDFRDNFICGSCAKKNEKAFCERSSSMNLNCRTSGGISEKDKENSATPLTSFERNTVRASVKRKRVEEQATSREEAETHNIKRQKKSSASLYNRNPASPMMRKARGEAIELPRNHKIPWRPKVPSRSTTPMNVTEDASYAEKVEAIIQNTVPGSEEELRLIMTKKSRVQRSPTKT